MSKAKNNLRFLLLCLCLVCASRSNAQDSTAPRLSWIYPNNALFCNDKQLLVDWSKDQMPFPTAYSKEFRIQATNLFVVHVSGCSGVACWGIFVFKETGAYWKLIGNSKITLFGKLTGEIETEVATEQQKLLFSVNAVRIGELPFFSL